MFIKRDLLCRHCVDIVGRRGIDTYIKRDLCLSKETYYVDIA